MFENIDFYEALKEEKRGGLDPCLSREENLNKLKPASRVWNKRFGAEADVIKQLINEAVNVFSNEKNYKKYRKWYIDYKLSGFIEGASRDGKITRKKSEETKDMGKKIGAASNEVEKLFQKMNIEISNNIPADRGLESIPDWLRRNKWVVYAVITVVVFLISYPFWGPKNSNSGSKIEQLILEPLNVVNHPTPAFSELRRAVPILLKYELKYKDNPLYKDRIRKGLLSAKTYCIKMGHEAPNYSDALDWYKIAQQIDPDDLTVDKLILEAEEKIAKKEKGTQ